MIEIFGGFAVHLYNLKVPKHCYDSNILSIKEEGVESHVKQSYDILVVKNDKSVHRGSLVYIRNMKVFNRNIVEQWALIHYALAAISHTKKHP